MRLASPPFFLFLFFYFTASNEKCAVCGASHIKQTARKRQKILLVAAACGILKWREGEGGRVGNKEKMALRIKRIVHNVWFPARCYCECPCRESSWTVWLQRTYFRPKCLYGSARNYLQWRSQTNVVKVYAQLWNCFGSLNYCESMQRSR